MQRPSLLVVALASMLGVAGIFAWTTGSSAQTSGAPPVLEACSPGKAQIDAASLPEPAQAEPGRKVFNLERCPVGKRIITDVEVGSVLPGPGKGVHAEALTTAGAEEVQIKHFEDGTVVVDEVGSEIEADLNPDPTVDSRARSASECQDTAFSQDNYRLYKDENWRFNRGTTPNEIGVAAAEDDLRRGGTNVASVRNNCGLGDGVGPGMNFVGDTDRGTGINASGGCTEYDGYSVTGFGDLPGGTDKRTLGVACDAWNIHPNTWNELTETNVRLNKVEATWTTNPTSDACRNRYGVEPVMTHERGHSFGLNHVSESDHGNQTMSTMLNGTCQASENTLGGGDVRGLNSKYP